MSSRPQIVAQVLQLWGRLGRGQKAAIGAIAVGAVVFSFILMQMGGSTTYVTAFTNLDPKDSNAIIEQIKADKVPYQLSTDGTTIKVPPTNLADARLKLAAKGLPQGGAVGYELFDKTSFGVTDFVQHLNYQRALEGELSRTINALTQVEGSRVHIVVPKEELFVSQKKPATASVLLRLRAGRELDENALKGISHLVARSVQGLDQKNITIIDSGGRMLFDGGSLADSAAGMSATQLDVQKKIEKGIETQVQSLLDRVAGANRAVVRASADMDFSQQEEMKEIYEPGGANAQGVPRSSASVQETFNGNGQAGGTPPGVAANNPNARTNIQAAAGGTSQYQRTETTTNYEVTKSTQKTVRGPGQIKRLSVSVLLDSSIPEQDAVGLRDAISAAAGIDQKRGDQIVVTTAAFSNAQTEGIPTAKPLIPDAVTRYGRLAVPLLAALIVLFVVWRMSRTVTPKLPKSRISKQELALAAASGGAGLPAGGGQLQLKPGEGRQALASGERWEPPEMLAKRKEIEERMKNLATANPDAVAEIIHSWMIQDDSKKS